MLRAKITFVILLSLNKDTTIAQQSTSINAGILYGYSMLNLNKQSSKYNNYIEDKTKVHYEKMHTFGITAGITKIISKRFALEVTPRWQKWGGSVKIIDNMDQTQFLKEDISYQSFRVPFALNYIIYNSNNLSINAGAGIGFDYTYHLSFIPSTYYGVAPKQTQNVEIITPFLSVGFTLYYKLKSDDRFGYSLGIIAESDGMFNTNRFNDFGGHFWHKSIPLHAHILYTKVAVNYLL